MRCLNSAPSSVRRAPIVFFYMGRLRPTKPWQMEWSFRGFGGLRIQHKYINNGITYIVMQDMSGYMLEMWKNGAAGEVCRAYGTMRLYFSVKRVYPRRATLVNDAFGVTFGRNGSKRTNGNPRKVWNAKNNLLFR